jgi:hypothetical protein
MTNDGRFVSHVSVIHVTSILIVSADGYVYQLQECTHDISLYYAPKLWRKKNSRNKSFSTNISAVYIYIYRMPSISHCQVTIALVSRLHRAPLSRRLHPTLRGSKGWISVGQKS